MKRTDLLRGVTFSIVLVALIGCGGGGGETSQPDNTEATENTQTNNNNSSETENSSSTNETENNQTNGSSTEISQNQTSGDTNEVETPLHNVNAGNDQVVTENSTVVLTGETSLASTETKSYAWTQISGIDVTLQDETSKNSSFVAPEVSSPQELMFQLTVTDSGNRSVSDTLLVLVNPAINTPPRADAGADRTALGQERVSISGNGIDDDGTIVSYQWTQTSGKSVVLEGDNTPEVHFNAPLVIGQELITLKLTVTDDQGASGDDFVDILISDKGSYQGIVSSGMRAIDFPDGYSHKNANYWAMGRSGHIAFSGAAETNTSTTSTSIQALWGGEPNNLRLVIKGGDSIEGLPSNVFFNSIGGISSQDSSKPIVVTPSGHIGFSAILSGAVTESNGVSLLAEVNGEVKHIVRTGTPAPGLPTTSTISRIVNFSFTDSGMLIFGLIDRYYTAMGLWYWDFDTVRLIAVTDALDQYSVSEESISFYPGCSYASISAEQGDLILFGSGGGISNQGHIVFSAKLVGTDCPTQAVLGWKDGQLYKIIDTNDKVPGIDGASYYGLSLIDLKDNGDILITAGLRQSGYSSKTSRWMIPNGATPKLIAMDDELTPPDYSSELWAGLYSTFRLGSNAKVFAVIRDVLGNDIKNPGYAVLSGIPRDSVPYQTLGESGAIQLDSVIRSLDVPPGYSERSIIEFDNYAPVSVNSANEMVFAALVYDAEVDVQHVSMWKVNDSGAMTELIKTGDTIKLNGEDQTLTRISFSGGSITRGSSAQYDDEGRLFMGAVSSDAWALLLVTPQN